jgi:hypothetical protein
MEESLVPPWASYFAVSAQMPPEKGSGFLENLTIFPN